MGPRLVIQSILGGTLTTCVVFIPLAFLEGLTGQMFKPLGFYHCLLYAGLLYISDDHCPLMLQPVPSSGEAEFSDGWEL